MNPLFTVTQIRTVEQSAAALLPEGALMQRAGLAATALALQLIIEGEGAKILVLAGPGNNGGDALEVAANLEQSGAEVSVLHFAGAQPSAEAARALSRARASGAQFIDALPASPAWALVVDGLFGIGLRRPLEGAVRAAVRALAELECPVLALDIPSGLDADTGNIVGPDGIAMRASHTITFIGDKPGLHTGHGRDYAGEVDVDTLEIDERHFPAAQAALCEPGLFIDQLQPRPQNSHKGSFGHLAIVGGATGMAGAAVLAGRAALMSGAGRVTVAALAPGLAFDSTQPELMFRDASSFEFGATTVVAGPGMGEAPLARQLLARLLPLENRLVLDADALNLIAADSALQSMLAARSAATILTPHPLEAARLLGCGTSDVQADRLASARALAARFKAIVVLKGSGSVIASPDGMAVVNNTGNPGLATAGTGDVLAGLCASLLAQSWPQWEAALGAVWIHGMAADWLCDEGIGPIGMTAGELPAAIRSVINQLVAAKFRRGAPPRS
jgi:hydroxyethylthiazole kinase-like uncharacterized protein yjeF